MDVDQTETKENETPVSALPISDGPSNNIPFKCVYPCIPVVAHEEARREALTEAPVAAPAQQETQEEESRYSQAEEEVSNQFQELQGVKSAEDKTESAS